MGGANAHYLGIAAFSETDQTEDLKAMKVPTLILQGDDDQIVPYKDASLLQAKLVPDANISMTVAAATYGGEQGYAGSISGRLADKVYISGSMSGNTGDKRVGGAVSATFGF